VLAQMVKYGKLSAAQFAQLQRRPLRIDFERQKEPPGPAPHFAQQLRKWLIGWADRNDYNIYSDGLIVRTTIDSRLQQIATQALTQQANQLQGIANNAWSGATVAARTTRCFAPSCASRPNTRRRRTPARTTRPR
jgi:penicillin-binding protein 1A